MSKELEMLKGRLGHINKTPLEEALDRLYECNDDDYTLGYQQHDYKLLRQALQRLNKYEEILSKGRLTDRNYKNTTLDIDSCKPYLRLGELEDIYEESKHNE